MRALLFLPFLIGYATALTCPSQYQLIEGRCIRVLELWKQMTLDDVLPGYRDECAIDGAHLPVIKNDEENENFADIVYSLNGNSWRFFWLVLDLVCNQTTRRLEWRDGTPVTYSRRDTVNFDNIDCVSSHDTVVSLLNPSQDQWLQISTTSAPGYLTVLCDYEGPATTTPKPTTTTMKTTPPTTTIPKTTTTKSTVPTTKSSETPGGQCGDYSVMDTSANAEKPCIKVYTDPISWNNASLKCNAEFASLITINSADENKYLWRTALSNNILEGMHIGAHVSPVDSSVWTWSDGEIPFNGKTYDNFMSSENDTFELTVIRVQSILQFPHQ